MLGKPRILSLYLFSSTCLINSIKHEHSCKILYLVLLLQSIAVVCYPITSSKRTIMNHISPADAGLDLDLWYIENILTDYDSQHLQTSESS